MGREFQSETEFISSYGSMGAVAPTGPGLLTFMLRTRIGSDAYVDPDLILSTSALRQRRQAEERYSLVWP
jgi:hypothetical protein